MLLEIVPTEIDAVEVECNGSQFEVSCYNRSVNLENWKRNRGMLADEVFGSLGLRSIF